MANIGVSYDSLAHVQIKLDDMVDGELSDARSKIRVAQNTITPLSEFHDNIWADELNTIQEQLTAMGESIRAVHELSNNTHAVYTTFYDEEGNIINNANAIGELLEFGFGIDPDPNGYTITDNTGAESTIRAVSTQSTPSGSYGGGGAAYTGAMTGTGASSTVSSSGGTTSSKTEKVEQKKDEPEKIEDEKEDNLEDLPEERDNNTATDTTTTSEDKNTSKDIKDSSTYNTATETAQKVTQTSTSKNVVSGTAGGSTITSATKAGSVAGTTPKDDKVVETNKDEIKAEALGDTVLDEDVIDVMGADIDTDNVTHQTSPIDVTIDKDSGTNVIPALAGVAAAGLAGVGTKVIIDKKEKDADKEENEEGQETFSGEYEVAGENATNLLDSSDDIGFNPEEIIEEDESNNNQNDLENTVFSQTVLNDLQAKEELM